MESTSTSTDQALNDLLAALPQMFPGVQEIPLSNIRPNPENPGPPITDQQIQELGQNIAEAGLLNHIKVRPDRTNLLAPGVTLHPENPRLRADGQPWTVGDFNYVILAGENRYRAFDYLKREAIPGSILNPTAKEAVKITHLDNDVRDRGWWAAYQTIEQYIQADPNLTQGQVAVELKMDRPKVNRALQLLPLLNPEARALISSNATNSNKGNKGISENAAAQLAGLGPGTGLKPGVKKKAPPTGSFLDPAQANQEPRLEASAQLTQKLWPYPPIPPETQDLVRRTLAVACDQQMTEAGVRSLVEGILKGESPETFQVPVKEPKAKRRSTVGSPSPYAEASGDRQSTANPQPEIATAQTTPIGAEPRNDSSYHSKVKVPTMGTGESLFWDQLAGVSIVSRIKSKIKKAERPAWWEALILAGATLLVPIKWIGHLAWKALKWVARELFHRTRQAARGLAKLVGGVVGGVLKMVFIVLLVLILIWGAYEVLFQHRSVGGLVKQVVMWPVHWVERKSTALREPQGPESIKRVGSQQSTANSEIPLNPPLSKRETDTKRKSPTLKKGGQGGFSRSAVAKISASPASNQSQPWNAETEDRGYIESEIAAVPVPAWIKPFPVEPAAMGSDMSIRRLGDLQDPEKYSLIVGHDKQHVLSVSPAMTGFTLTYGDGLPIGGFLGGPAKIEFYWEDVRAIHCDEIKNGTQTLFQLGLVVNGLKKPFIVQCPTKEGLSHLVSAFEFWIGAAGAGPKAPVTGMPYLFQGLWVNNESKVTAVWADSPASQAGLRFGDVIWSLEADATQLQKNQDLEAGLQSLTPGQHDLYVVTPADWGDRVPIKDIRNVRAFKVKRQKMEIVVP